MHEEEKSPDVRKPTEMERRIDALTEETYRDHERLGSLAWDVRQNTRHVVGIVLAAGLAASFVMGAVWICKLRRWA
jgi:hypothetical protein